MGSKEPTTWEREVQPAGSKGRVGGGVGHGAGLISTK